MSDSGGGNGHVFIDPANVTQVGATLAQASVGLSAARQRLLLAANQLDIDFNDPLMAQADVSGRAEALLAILAAMAEAVLEDGEQMLSTSSAVRAADQPLLPSPVGSVTDDLVWPSIGPPTGPSIRPSTGESDGHGGGGWSWLGGGPGNWFGSADDLSGLTPDPMVFLDTANLVFDETSDTVTWTLDTATGLYRWADDAVDTDDAVDSADAAGGWLRDRSRESASHAWDAATSKLRTDWWLTRWAAREGVRHTVGEDKWNKMVDEATPVLARAAYAKVSKINDLIGFFRDPVGVANEVLFEGTYGKPEYGDLGGTDQPRQVRPFRGASSGGPTQRGQETLIYLMAETGADSQLHPDGSPPQIYTDEFELIDHDDNVYSVVLGGVVDLSKPAVGLNPHTRTPRDTDRVATDSIVGTSTANNQYARSVQQALQANGVPEGAQLMLVGHSQGSDTAVDLAADPVFNGELYNVTHVVGAAYHSDPQLEFVPPETEVLILKNNFDVPVLVESVPDELKFATDSRNDHGGVVVEFDGGWTGFGHHQDNYTDYLGRTPDENGDVAAFYRSVSEAGYTQPGSGTSIDISIDDPNAKQPEGLLTPVVRELNEIGDTINQLTDRAPGLPDVDDTIRQIGDFLDDPIPDIGIPGFAR